MFAQAALRFANHALSGEAWARTRLQTFAGQTAQIEFGKFIVPLTITDDGLLSSAEPGVAAAVTISLAADSPLLALAFRPSLLSSTRIAGSAELAETLGFVFHNLHWDPEDDLSRLVGDVAAHRLLQGGRKFVQWHQSRAKNFAINVAEYLTEEAPGIARRSDVEHFSSTVNSIEDDCNHVEARLRRLENR